MIKESPLNSSPPPHPKLPQFKLRFPRFKLYPRLKPHLPKLVVIVLSLIGITLYFGAQKFLGDRQFSNLSSAYQQLTASLNQSHTTMADLQQQLDLLKSRDEYRINQDLEAELVNIRETYQQTVDVYEDLLNLKDQTKNTLTLDQNFAQILTLLANRNYAAAAAKLKTLQEDIDKQQTAAAAAFQIPASVAPNNSAPSSGYQRQRVTTPVGEFLVDIIAADLGSTRVIVDTAADSDCGNDCPVFSLGDYVARNGAFAGVNGSYFCPASYPSCAGKTNSFDLLVMNKNKTYFNSDNNVYSTNPAVIFGDGWVRFVAHAQEWGRDTGVDGVLSNYPLLVSGGNNVFAGDSDPKKGSRAGRSFVASRGSTVYIGVVYNSTVDEAGAALTTLGMEYAMNLDSGGSTALWSGGYKAGPGRNIPNAILFVGK